MYFPTHIHIETHQASASSASRANDTARSPCAPAQSPLQTNAPQRLDMALYEALLHELQGAPHPLAISLYWEDEPLANPSFFAYARLGRERLPTATWFLETSSAFLNEARIAELKALFSGVTINVHNEAEYDAFDEHEFSLVPARFPHRIQLPTALQRARGFADREDEAIFHVNELYHEPDHAQEAPPHDPKARCMRPWTQAAISASGEVYLCRRDFRREYLLGSLREQSLWDCYNGPDAQAARALMEQGAREAIPMCASCPKTFHSHFGVVEERAWTRSAALLRLRETQHRRSPAASVGALQEEGALASLHHELALRQVPYGLHTYSQARAWARTLGHIALPGFLPLRYEYVVGVTPALATALVRLLHKELQGCLKGIWVCGSRVVSRAQLKLLDPATFAPEVPEEDTTCSGDLKIGAKGHLREFGPDPRVSSDLDLKVLLDEEAFQARFQEEPDVVGRRIGQRMEALSPYMPLSGHSSPRVRLLLIPASCVSARDAFIYYNAKRMEWLHKGPISLEHVLLLFDPDDPKAGLGADPFAPIREQLVSSDEGNCQLMAINTLQLPDAWHALDRGEKLRTDYKGLSVHQMIGALCDFPTAQPKGIVVEESGLVLHGEAAVWAGKEAGREEVAIRFQRTLQGQTLAE